MGRTSVSIPDDLMEAMREYKKEVNPKVNWSLVAQRAFSLEVKRRVQKPRMGYMTVRVRGKTAFFPTGVTWPTWRCGRRSI